MTEEKRYYEAEFRDKIFFCVIGNAKPTLDEVENLLKSDIDELMLGKPLGIREITREQAEKGYDLSREKEFPVFKREEPVDVER